MATKSTAKFSDSVPVSGGGVRSGRSTPGSRRWLLLFLLGLIVCAPFLYRRASDSAEAGTNLEKGAQYLAQGNPAEAERAWIAASRLTPDDPNVYHALKELYLAQGRLPDARRAANRLADLAPDEPHALCEVADAEVHAAQGELPATAFDDAVRAAKIEAACVRAQTVAGDACLRKGDYKQGLAYLRRAIQVKQEDVPLKIHAIEKMLETSDLKGAREISAELLRGHPGYSQGYVLMAAACELYPRDSPEYRSTENLLLTALRLDPTNALAHAKYGHYYLTTGNGKRALAHLEAAEYLGYHASSLLYDIHRAYVLQGRNAEAKSALDDFNKLSLLENDVTVLNTQTGMSPGDTALQKRFRTATDLLRQARREYDSRWTVTDAAPSSTSGTEDLRNAHDRFLPGTDSAGHGAATSDKGQRP